MTEEQLKAPAEPTQELTDEPTEEPAEESCETEALATRDDGAEAEESAASEDRDAEEAEDERGVSASIPVSGDNGELCGDLAELISAFPELYGTERLEDVPKYARYRMLRGQGLTPKEAYYASNGEGIIKYRLEADRRRELRAQTAHLTSVIGRSEVSERVMSESEKRAARIALGYSASDAELERLWKRVNSGGERN